MGAFVTLSYTLQDPAQLYSTPFYSAPLYMIRRDAIMWSAIMLYYTVLHNAMQCNVIQYNATPHCAWSCCIQVRPQTRPYDVMLYYYNIPCYVKLHYYTVPYLWQEKSVQTCKSMYSDIAYYGEYSTRYNMECHTALCTLYSALCNMYSVFCTLYSSLYYTIPCHTILYNTI